MSVYKKLHQIQSATRSLGANAEGQTGSAHYNYVSGSKLLGIIRPLMDKIGLLLTQEVIGITNTPTTYMTRNGEKTEMFTSLHIKFTWIDVEDGSMLVNEFFANGMNAWDKGLGSALTYAERYYLMKTLHIATDEDDIDALVKDEAINEVTEPVVEPVATPVKRTRRSAPKEDVQISTLPYTPMSIEDYNKIVKAYALGKKTKTGGDYMETWMTRTNATEKEVNIFLQDVELYKKSINQ